VESDEEIRRRIERQFRLQLCAVRDLDALSERFLAAISTGRGNRHKADSIIAFSAARETTTFQATLRLVESGFGRQAMMLNRSTFEGMAVACWVAANRDEAVDRFDKANEFEIHLLREKVLASQPDAVISDEGKLGPERVKECERLFGKNNQRLWTGHRDLWALVKDIEGRWEDAERNALKMYLGYEHERNNKELHPSASALFASVSNPTARQDGRPGMSLRIGPGSAELDAAFLGLFFIQQNLLRVLVEEFDLGIDALGELADCVEKNQYAFTEKSNLIDGDIGRNDLCWCDSGKKYKKCHGS
jgi:SEC-C motif